MEIYALDSTNVEDFAPLLTPLAVEGIKAGKDTQGFVVKEGSHHVGALAGGFTDEGIYEISSLFVLPDFRKQGVGELLLDTLYHVLEGIPAEVRVSFASVDEDDKALEEFLDHEGFDEYRESDEQTYRVSLASLANTKLKEEKPKVVYPSFAEVPKKVFTAFEKEAGEKAAFLPMPEGGFLAKEVDSECSTAIVKDGKLKAYAVIEKLPEDALMLSSLYVSEEEKPTSLLRLLRCTLGKLLETYEEDTEIYLPTSTEDSEEMITTLFSEDDPALSNVMVSYRKLVGTAKPNFENMDFDEFLFHETDEDDEPFTAPHLMELGYGEPDDYEHVEEDSENEEENYV